MTRAGLSDGEKRCCTTPSAGKVDLKVNRPGIVFYVICVGLARSDIQGIDDLSIVQGEVGYIFKKDCIAKVHRLRNKLLHLPGSVKQ